MTTALSAGPAAPTDPAIDVESMAGWIRAECRDSDNTRRLPDSVIGVLRDAGVFRRLAPIEIGGAETDPVTFLELVEAAAYADGSVGWCTMIGGCYSTFGGLLPPGGARDVYGDPETISAGAFRPDGMAVEADGGYRVSGRWPLASGSSHATWYLGGCVVHRDGRPALHRTGAPVVREFFFPAAVTEIVDTWESTGLRGTASHDYVVRDIFVPASHSMWFADPPACDRPLYRMPTVAMFATFVAAVPLGIARHALDEFILLAGEKVPVLSTVALADKPQAQDRLGRAYALVAAGRRFLSGTLSDLWRAVQAGRAPTEADRGRLWLAAAHAAHGALEAVELMYTAAGASSVYSRSPLDRCLRDARTAVQHICTQELHYELTGRLLLGREPVPSPWAIDDRSVFPTPTEEGRR